jgi:hypothetical protein
MKDSDDLKARIAAAFANVEYPGDWCLVNSREGEEPMLLAREFAGRDDWRALDAPFIDGAPDGYSSALSFFSDEALRFYLPAYLCADLDGGLRRIDLVFHLTHGLDDASRNGLINRRRYGARTWFDEARHRFATLDREQAAAVVAYLERKRDADDDDFDRDRIDQALAAYWHERAGGGYEPG